MVNFPMILGLTLFFTLFFLIFTITPRFIFAFVKRLLTMGSKNFINNYFDMLKLYLFLGVPLTIILYQASFLGNQQTIKSIFGNNLGAVSFVTILVILISIRLSILLKKQPILIKIPYIKHLNKILPKDQDKKELKNEYFSYLFDVFFTSFLAFSLILIFNVLFLPDQTLIILPSIKINIINLFKNISDFLKSKLVYILIFLILPLISEIFLKIVGYYDT